MDDLQSILDTLSMVLNSGDKMPEVDLVQVMDEIWSLLQEDASALGITSGKYIALRGDPRGLDDKDVLKAVRSHVPKETYKEMVAASKEGELQGEFGDWFADDQDDELYRVLEPIARKKDLLEDLEYTSNVVFFNYPATKRTGVVIAADWYWHDGKFFNPHIHKSVKALEKMLVTDRAIEPHDFEYH